MPGPETPGKGHGTPVDSRAPGETGPMVAKVLSVQSQYSWPESDHRDLNCLANKHDRDVSIFLSVYWL